MSFWKSASGNLKKIMGQTNKAIESGKIQFEIGQFKSKINAVYRDLGKHVHALSQGGQLAVDMADPKVVAAFKDIEYFLGKIKELEDKEETVKD